MVGVTATNDATADELAGQRARRGWPRASQCRSASDSSIPYWTVLLPAIPGVILLPADLMTDDLGRNAVVTAAELTDLGWRITVKQATT